MSEAVRLGIEAIYSDLKRHARALTRNATAADDLTSATIERALTNAADFAEGTNLRAWAKAIMHGLHRNDRRRDTKRWFRERDVDRMEFPVQAVQDLRMEVDDVHRVIATLPPDQRAAIFLHVYEGLSYEATAQELGVEIGTVKSRISRARDTIRVSLEAVAPRVGAAPGALPLPK